jgi:hypothetical protein
VASGGSTHHLTVVDNTLVRSAHCIVVLVTFFSNDDKLTMPLVLAKILSNILFTFASRVKRNYSGEIFKGKGLRRKTGGCRVFEQEFFDTTANILNTEFSLGTLVSGGKEDYGRVFRETVFSSPRRANVSDTLFEVRGKILLRNVEFILIVRY